MGSSSRNDGVAELVVGLPCRISFAYFGGEDHGQSSQCQDEIQGLDISQIGILGYVNEDPVIVQSAGRNISTPRGPVCRGKATGPKSPAGKHSTPVSYS